MTKFDPAAYLASLNINVMRFGLKTISELLSVLGNPQNSFKTILIAGTNGKGSTAAMIASILQCAGYKTGLYTSPHLIDVRERIRVNGKIISWQDFRRDITVVKEAVNKPATYFEVLTAAAFLYFQRRQIDIAVLEVGLGGRLDATNVCRPLVSVITNIGFDHMSYLGSTLTAIAREKAGIIKQGGICLTAVGQKKVLGLLANICRRRRAALYYLGKSMKMAKQKDGLYTYQGIDWELKNLSVPLLGRHQLDNAALALAAVEIIAGKGFPAASAAICKGLAETRWEARLEILRQKPLFVLDGAHNPAGISVLCRALKNDFAYRRLILIFGALSDKNYRLMLRKIMPLASHIILTQLPTTRAVPVSRIREFVKKSGYTAETTDNVAQAVLRALTLAADEDMICAAGSLYLAGAVKQSFPGPVSCGKKPKLI
jgi:dihydrofolate synthase / folylpolyglutamate synthase